MNSPTPHPQDFYHCDNCNSEVAVNYIEAPMGFYLFYYYCHLCEATFSCGGTIPIHGIPQKERSA